MSRVHYVSANGQEPPLTELEEEKLKGQRLANEIAETKLRRLHEEVLEKREVKFVVDTMAIVLQQQIMRRTPNQVVTDLRGMNLSHEVLHTIKMSVDKTLRAELDRASTAAEKALNAREAYAELTGQREPSEKAVDKAKRKKARVNARRRVLRKVAK